jgi:hypothetical protein
MGYRLCLTRFSAVAACVGGLGLSSAGIAGAGTHHVAASKAQPRITIASPAAKLYAAGSKLLFKFSCTAPSGIASCSATLSGAGTNRHRVLSGSRIVPAKTGRYTLRIVARDRRGISTNSALQFLVERAIRWSGYTWFVRPPGWGGPGPNHWSDSSANARVSGRNLVLSVVRDRSGHWTSTEIDNQRHLGYGTYRWVVASDLSKTDPNQVLGLFTFGGTGPYGDEVDIESSQWGNPLSMDGSAAVWQSTFTHATQFTTFDYSSHPPYVAQFTWSPGKVSFLITDATGAVLLDWAAVGGVPTSSGEVPVINYWRFHGVPPDAVRSVRISSFTWTPLGASDRDGPGSTRTSGRPASTRAR